MNWNSCRTEAPAGRRHLRRMQRVKKVGADFPNQSDALLAEGIERERAEEKLARLNRTLQTVNQCNKAFVRATEEYELLGAVCRILVDVGGLRMAWVGYREFDKDKTVSPVAHAGYEAGYLGRFDITWGDTESGSRTHGRGHPHRNDDLGTGNILTDPNMALWRRRGALARLRLCHFHSPDVPRRVIWRVSCSMPKSRMPSPEAVEQYTDLANNLAYGVMALRTVRSAERAESEIRQFNASLEKRVD